MAGTGDGCDDPIGSDGADTKLIGVGDINVPGGVERQSDGIVQDGFRGQAVVAAIADVACTRERVERAVEYFKTRWLVSET